jgi:hypothetical protein
MKAFGTIVLLLFVGLQIAFGGNLLYIYSHKSIDDSVQAVRFKAFFDSLGHSTALAKTNQISGLNLTQYALLIISSGSGSSMGWHGDASSVTAIKNSEKPIIGMGSGGPNLFDSLHLWCGWGNSAGGNGGAEVIHDRSHQIFNTPAPVVTPGTDTLVIDMGGSDGQTLWAGGTVPADVILFGRSVVSQGYATLALEKGKYFYWGFAAPPTDMTPPARQLLTNILYYLTVTLTDVSGNDASQSVSVPSEFALLQNYPNPFNPKTVVSCQLPAASKVRLAVYDMLGREIAILFDGQMETGRHSVLFDATSLASGTYICRLTADGFVQSQKMLLTK